MPQTTNSPASTLGALLSQSMNSSHMTPTASSSSEIPPDFEALLIPAEQVDGQVALEVHCAPKEVYNRTSGTLGARLRKVHAEGQSGNNNQNVDDEKHPKSA